MGLPLGHNAIGKLVNIRTYLMFRDREGTREGLDRGREGGKGAIT